MTRKQLEKIVRYLDNAVEELVKHEQEQSSTGTPVPDRVYNNIQSAIAMIENELTLEEEIEPLDFKKKSWHEELEDLADSIEDD